jgi:hypothetical protein
VFVLHLDGFATLFANKKASGMILITLCLGVAYLLTPLTMRYANISVSNLTGTQVYFSTDPAVPYQDENSVSQAMIWCNQNLASNACIILQHHFFEYGQLYLNSSQTIMHYSLNVDSAVNKALKSGFQIYFIWWNQPVGWGDFSLPENFTAVQDFGRISVYGYEM